MIQRSLDVVHDRHRELVEETVELICRDVVGPTEISHDGDLITVCRDVQRISLSHLRATEASNSAATTNFETPTANSTKR